MSAPKKKLSDTIRIRQVCVSRTSKVGGVSHFVSLTASYEEEAPDPVEDSSEGGVVVPPPKALGWTLRESRLVALQIGHNVMQSSYDLMVADGDLSEDEAASHRLIVKDNYKRYLTGLLGSS